MSLTRKGLFEKRFKDHYSYLCRIAYRYIQDKEECEDIVQETFISIWQKNKDDLSEKDFVSYIVKAVKNNCISSIRKRKQDTLYLEDLVTSPLPITSIIDDEESDNIPPEEVLIKLLSILPPKCKEVFLMCKLQKMKYREVAQELNLSEKTIENHIGKAIRMLREYIKSGQLLVLFIVLLSTLIIF